VLDLEDVEADHLQAVTGKAVYATLTDMLAQPKIEAKLPVTSDAIAWALLLTLPAGGVGLLLTVLYVLHPRVEEPIWAALST
jgi:hypothetical protein